jgi:hypothetical protein
MEHRLSLTRFRLSDIYEMRPMAIVSEKYAREI